MRGMVHPVRQHPADPLKTEISRTPVPIPQDLALALSRHVEDYSTRGCMCDEAGRQLGPWGLQRHTGQLERKCQGCRRGSGSTTRHYYASLLISSGLDVKVVQARLRHAPAKTTLDTYGHLWPDSDETTRAVISGVITARSGIPAAKLCGHLEAVVKRLS